MLNRIPPPACPSECSIYSRGSAQRLARDECTSTASALSEDDVVRELTPCASGATAACCEAGQKWAGLNEGAPLAGCLCYPELLDQVVALAEGNAQAKAFGVDREFITGLLQECGVPYAGGTGAAACPSDNGGGSASASAGADAGASASAGSDGSSASASAGGFSASASTNGEYSGANPMTVQGGGGGMLLASSTDEGDKDEGDKGEGDKGGDDTGGDSGKGGCDGGWWDGCENALAGWQERPGASGPRAFASMGFDILLLDLIRRGRLTGDKWLLGGSCPDISYHGGYNCRTEALMEAFVGMVYQPGDTPATLAPMMEAMYHTVLPPHLVERVLGHASLHLAIMVTQVLPPYDALPAWQLKAAFWGFLAANFVSPALLARFQRRLCFHTGSAPPPFFEGDEGVTCVPLTAENVYQVLAATTCLPFISPHVEYIDGVGCGLFFDGALGDFHLNVVAGNEHPVLLLGDGPGPGFKHTLWDAYVPFRAPRADVQQGVSVLYPTHTFVARQPSRRLPTTFDYFNSEYVACPQLRHAHWRAVFDASVAAIPRTPCSLLPGHDASSCAACCAEAVAGSRRRATYFLAGAWGAETTTFIRLMNILRRPVVSPPRVYLGGMPDSTEEELTSTSDQAHGPRTWARDETRLWAMLERLIGLREASDRLISEATTYGVVSALLLTLSYSSLVSPPEFSSSLQASTMPPEIHPLHSAISYSGLMRIYMYMLCFSIMCSICSINFSTLMVVHLNQACNKAHMREFIDTYISPVYGMSWGNHLCFNGSFLGLGAAMAVVMVVKYEWVDVCVCISILSSIYVFFTVFVSFLDWGFSYGRIRAAYVAACDAAGAEARGAAATKGNKVVPLR
ncbi:hypothetical protein FOA52_013032 [Chlamydomonas sp. UWO 241]|nr:hypothetical protein FOA52_013032 [Chlamydomonas sp. UWO 241]